MEQLKNESSRQYEYMEEMKKWVQKKSEELGRKVNMPWNNIWLSDE